MERIVRSAFRAALDQVVRDARMMPIDHVNESIFRYHFSRHVASQHPSIQQLVEADRIDLVLRNDAATALIEFKFYLRRPRISAFDGQTRGSKGGAGARNRREFQTCIDRLHALPSSPTIEKYVAVAYANPAHWRGARVDDSLGSYEHPTADVELGRLEDLHLDTVDDSPLRGSCSRSAPRRRLPRGAQAARWGAPRISGCSYRG